MKKCEACGQKLKDKRSVDQNALFHYLIKMAYENWPEASKFKPDNKEHLRAYLTVKVGHSVTSSINLPDKISPKQIQLIAYGVIHSVRKDAFIKVMDDQSFQVAHARTTKFEKLGSKQFNKVLEDIIDLIDGEYIKGFRKEYCPPDTRGLDKDLKPLDQQQHQIAPD